MRTHDPLEVVVVWISLALLGLLLLSMAYGRYREWQLRRRKRLPESEKTISHVRDSAQTTAATAPKVQVATQAAPQVIALRAIADADNILIVGPKGSGKTTLLQLLLALRSGAHSALDPHNAPGKWPCDVVGGGRQFGKIDGYLQSIYRDLDQRYTALHEGRIAEGQFSRLTLVGDEWRAIAHEVPGDRRAGRLGAGDILLKLLAEGRKVALCVLAASHNDTAASMGMAGDMAMLTCFDWIVYLGALAARKLPAASQMPRPAVAYHPERDSYYVLDLSSIASADRSILIRQSTRPAVSPTMRHVASAQAQAARHGVMAAQQDVVSLGTEDGAGAAVVSGVLTDEAIRVLYRAWGSKNRVAALLQGTKSKRLAQIDAALAADQQR